MAVATAPIVNVSKYVSLIVPEHNSGLLPIPLPPVIGASKILEMPEGFRAISVVGTPPTLVGSMREGPDFVQGFQGASGQGSIVLVHFDGTNGSTLIQDQYGNVWTAHGGAQLTTSNSKFGTASLTNGATTDWVSTPGGILAPIYAGSDFTYEIQVYPTAYPAAVGPDPQAALFDSQVNETDFAGVNFTISPAGHLVAIIANAAGSMWQVLFAGSGTVPLNTWTHCAMVRSGNTCTLYQGGVNVGTGTFTDTTIHNDGGDLQIGNAQNGGGGFGDSFFTGQLDEARVSTVARYTSDFTPPPAPFIL